MPRARRVCSHPGCPTPATGTRCTQHEREHDRARGTRKARGYGSKHDKLRAQWAARIRQGGVTCARCGTALTADQPWHLDHSDDRATYLGPSCAHCNLSAAGKASHPHPRG